MKIIVKLLIGALIVIPGLAAYAQQTTGEITGTVSDTSGAVVPGAAVTATNVATQQVRATSSNGTGNYTIPYLTPGVYVVKASKQGFQTEQNSQITLDVGAVLKVDFKMQVGEVTQQVEVSTAAPMISTESTAVQDTVENDQIVALPLNGRDYLQLVALNPNVVSEVGITSGLVGLGGARASDVISVAGQRLEYNHYTLDGVENTEPNYNTYIIRPSVDALQEFTVMTGVYSAEFGRGASQINATTLPGGNTYHGVAYDFLRNDAADARIWTQTGSKNPFHREDYGFVLDGPLTIPHIVNGKDKLFFTSSFEALRDNEYLQEKDSVPTQDMRNGNFSDNIPGELPIYWPLSQVFNGPTKGACQISSGGSYNPSTGQCTVSGTLNVIPNGTITSIAKTLLGLYPLPNQYGGASEETNSALDYIVEQPQITQSTQFNQRVDWQMNARSILFGRISWESDLYSPASALGKLTGSQVDTTAKQIVIGHTFVINSHMVNEARAGWDYFHNLNASSYANGTFDPEDSLGISGLTDIGGPANYAYPTISPSGMTSIGGPSLNETIDNIYDYMDSLSIVKGKQSIKLGGSFEADEFNEFGNQFSTGSIAFTGDDTLNPAIGTTATTSGFGLADMELGYVSGAFLKITALSNVEERSKKYAAFFQDDWKVTPSLTFNLGIRYDNIRPWQEKHDDFFNEEFFSTGVSIQSAAPGVEPLVNITATTADSPIYTRPGPSGCNFYANASLQYSEPGQPVQCGNQYMGPSTMSPNNKNFGPRVGIDYALGTKTSIRGGYGIYYVEDQAEDVFDMGRNLGGKYGNAASPPLGDYVPLTAPWSTLPGSAGCGPNQYNGGVAWTGPCFAAAQILSVGHNNRTPYVEQYILVAQRQLSKNVALEVGYTGSESHHDLRKIVPNQDVPKTGPTDTRSILQRTPWPALAPNNEETLDWDRSNYNSLDLKLTQHVSHGLLYQVSYTWGHSLDYGSAYRTTGGDNLVPQNSYWLRHEYGDSQFNQPQNFVASFNYNLPFGQGKDFAPSNRIVNHIVSGWVAGGILTFGHGTNMEVSSAGDPSQLGISGGTGPEYQGVKPFKNPHPGIIGGIASNRGYWNPAAFDCAYTATVTSYCSTPGYPNQSWQMGNWARESLYAPGYENFDANFGRTFHIWESHTLLVRLEAFNSTNHVNWGRPSSTVPSSATFGAITSAQSMRELQAAIKYSF